MKTKASNDLIPAINAITALGKRRASCLHIAGEQAVGALRLRFAQDMSEATFELELKAAFNLGEAQGYQMAIEEIQYATGTNA